MSIAQEVIKRLPGKLRYIALKTLYKKQGVQLQAFKTLCNDRFFLYKINGVYVPSESIGWFVTYPYYEEWVDTLSAAFYKPKNGDVVLDIGAGMGEEVIVFSKKVGNTGKVYCIEANPRVFSVLENVVSLNNLNNVLAFNIAINYADKEVVLEDDDASFLRSAINATQPSSNTRKFTVAGKRVDSFMLENGIDTVDLLKVNIEGAERFVIDSIGSSIKKIRNVAISCHDFRFRNEGGNEFFRTKEMVTAYLKQNGFSIQSLNTGIEHKDDWIFGTNLHLYS